MKKIYCYAVILAVFVSCNQANKKEEKSAAVSDSETKLADPKIQKIYTHYIDLKNALVKSDSAEAKKVSDDLSAALADVKGCQITSQYADSVSLASNIKDQRAAFHVVSADIMALVKHADIQSGKIFIQHCPMANDGKGAHWLANEKDVKNPYYGDEMLECGSVEETLSKN